MTELRFVLNLCIGRAIRAGIGFGDADTGLRRTPRRSESYCEVFECVGLMALSPGPKCGCGHDRSSLDRHDDVQGD